MKKKIAFITFLLLVSIIAKVAWTAYQYYAPPKQRVPYRIAKHDDTIRIAYIGDSWAFIHSKHQCLIPGIIEGEFQRPTIVYSYGLPGRTSKRIYENMFDNEGFKQFLQSQGYDFCFISAGINDTNKKVGIRYYQESMDYLINFMLSNQIHPIILEIPDYDIEKSFRWKKTDRKLLGHISMIINGVSIDCKQKFRNALDELVQTKGYQDKVSIIRYKSWNNNYSEDLKKLYLKDGVHLNDYGNAVLDSIIAKVILSKLKKE